MRGHWYPRNRILAWLTDPPYAWSMVLLAGMLTIWFSMLSPAALPGILIAWLLAPGLGLLLFRGAAYGWRLDGEGLHELHFLRPDRTIPWSDLQAAEAGGEYLVIETRYETLRLPRRVRGTRHLAKELRAALGQQDGPHVAVTLGQLATWLAIGPDERLDVGCHPALRYALSLMMGGLAAFMLVAGMLDGQPTGVIFAWWPALLAASFWSTTQPVWVTTRGIHRGRRWSASWDDVTGIRRMKSGWMVATELGSVSIGGGRKGRRVHDTVKKVLAAKQAGGVLPRIVAVPAEALSRAAPAEVVVERGISRAE